MDTGNLPAQPEEKDWRFVQKLQEPLWTGHNWTSRETREGEVSLASGVRIVEGFDAPERLLRTAYDDLRSFLRAGRVPTDGPFVIRTGEMDTEVPEAFRIEVSEDGCRILAGDTEGIRRGIFCIEDEMLRAGGPFLPLGALERKPFIRTRVSRCFFGPIKRPPKMRDELMDDVNYYPDEYLNRLAHEGVNGLWLTIEFRDLCRTSITPEYGKDAERRLAKLRRTVDTCSRYGIKIYVFCIEPRAWGADSPVLKRHPELGRGGASWDRRRLFCPFSDAAQQYLYEATNGIFSAVPGLGGLINISHGERGTTCLSAMRATSDHGVQCPVCSEKEPWEILHASLSAMERGVHDANPDAELISWLYMPQPEDLGEWVYDIPAHTPEGVVLQFNFESGVRKETFGTVRTGGDYWLSCPGPSERFERVAHEAREAGTRLSAKIQTACSHEVASIPFVPVPSLLYRKFAAMRELGVSASMLCWYFGNYPGLMNKAAGELSFEPFPENEDAFLAALARIHWGAHAEKVVEAWRLFSEGYGNYPLTILFQYYGPMHDGPVWPLLLKPEDAPLSPTWLLGSAITREPFPPSGDRIGESFGFTHTLEEILELCRRMTTSWDEGLAILKGISSAYREDRERLLDIGLAEALGVQFRSGYNIYRFYDLREKMLRMEGPERLELLGEMRAIAQTELANDEELLALCTRDSRLGFHPEAEGYKYFPPKIRWRMDQLRLLLEEDFPEVEDAIREGALVYPEYTGRTVTGPHVVCRHIPEVEACWRDPTEGFPPGVDLRSCEAGGVERATTWAVCHDTEQLYLIVRCMEPDMARLCESGGPGRNGVVLKLEPRRLWPCRRFTGTAVEGRSVMEDVEVRTSWASDAWWCVMRIPFRVIEVDSEALAPIRIDVQRTVPGEQAGGSTIVQCWIEQHPWTPRLALGADNPMDLGWLVFEWGARHAVPLP